MKPICVPCQRFFRMKESGYYFIEGMPIRNGVLPGNSEPNGWKPYKIWSGDLWECFGCGAQIVSGVGSGPISEHYHEEFERLVESLNANQLQINDC